MVFLNLLRILTTLIIVFILFLPYKYPKIQLTLNHVDPNLIEVYENCGRIYVDSFTNVIAIHANPYSTPIVTLITSPASFEFAVDLSISSCVGEVIPAQIAIWDPVTQRKFGIDFLSNGTIMVATWIVSGKVLEEAHLIGKYTLNNTYHIRIVYDKENGINMTISNSSWPYSIIIKKASILDAAIVNLSLHATAYNGSGSSFFYNCSLVLPTQAYYQYFIEMNYYHFLLYAIILLLMAISWGMEIISLAFSMFMKLKSFIMKSKSQFLFMLSLLSTNVLLYVYFTLLGSHPYDMFTQKIWIYVISRYGIQNLYPMTLLIPSGRATRTISVINAEYPYPSLPIYFYYFICLFYSLITKNFNFDDLLLTLIIKISLFFINFIISLIIFIESMEKVANNKIVFILPLLFILNPGVIFVSSIWGQIDSLVILFIVLTVLMLSFRKSKPMWFFLGLAVLTKQVSLIAAVITFFIAIKKFHYYENIMGFLIFINTIFIVNAPLLFMGYSPFYLLSRSIGEHVINVINARPKGVSEWSCIVSSFAFNIWPLLTWIINRTHGLNRFFYPDYLTNFIGLKYVDFGIIIFSCFMTILLFIVIFGKFSFDDIDFYLIFMAFFTFYMFPTRIHERYLGYAIPFLILSYFTFKNKTLLLFFYIVLSYTYFVSVIGAFIQTAAWYPGILPFFYPEHSLFNMVIYKLITLDEFISLNSFINIVCYIIAFIYLLYSSFPLKFKIPKIKIYLRIDY